MSSTLDSRMGVLEQWAAQGGRGRCWCVWREPLDGGPPPPALCPHGRPWAIKVVYDDGPIAHDDDAVEGRTDGHTR